MKRFYFNTNSYSWRGFEICIVKFDRYIDFSVYIWSREFSFKVRICE